MNHRSIGGLSRLSRSKDGAGNKKQPGPSTNMVLLSLIVIAFAFSGTMLLSFNPSTIHSYDQKQIQLANQKEDVSVDNIQYAQSVQEPRRHSEQKEPMTMSPNRDSMADLVTWILLGEKSDKDFKTPDNALKRMRDSPTSDLEFAPGTLHLSHEQTLQHCYTDPNIFKKHFRANGSGKNIRVSFSDEHKLAYVMLPKSGSSTARFMLQHEFQATEKTKPLLHSAFEKGESMEGVEVITFVRDPLSRFYSQYDEAYVRTAPWQKTQNPFYEHPHPFPFIHENLRSYQDYEDVFCPPSTRSNPNNRRECLFRPSQENGTLTSRFERFVREYDGLDPFDIHLHLQVPLLSSNNGKPMHITQIYNTSDSERAWKAIATQFLGEDAALGKAENKATGNTKVSGGVIEGRSYPRRFNSSLVTVETQRRICGLALLDYCCLNLPLPAVCKGPHYNGRELLCALDRKGRIQPGIMPNENGELLIKQP